MEFEHSKKGSKWKKHKYLRVENGKYIYKDSSGRSSAGNNAAYRFKWTNRYDQEAKENKAKTFSNGVNMYTRRDGTTVITYPGHAAWTVPVGTNLVKLSARLESMAKSYKMGGLQSSDPTKKAKATEDFLNALTSVIGGSTNVKGGTSGDSKPKEQTDEQPQEQKPEEQPQQEQPQNPAPAPQQQSQPDVSGAQEQKPRMVTGAEAESSKSRLKRIGVRKNKLYEEAQKLTEQLTKDPKNEDLREEVNDLYDEIDHYNDEVIEHITTLKDFGLSNEDILKYADSVDLALDPNSLEPYYLNLKNKEKRNSIATIQHSITKSLFDQYFPDKSTNDIEDDEFAHVGRSKRDGAKVGSGRYPLGSGENPRAGKIRDKVKKLFKTGKYEDVGYDFEKSQYEAKLKNGKHVTTKDYKKLSGNDFDGNKSNTKSQNGDKNHNKPKDQSKTDNQDKKEDSHKKQQNSDQNQQKQQKQNNEQQNWNKKEQDYQRQLADLQKQYNQQMQMLFQMQQMQMMSNQQQQQEMRQMNQQYQQALNRIQNDNQQKREREPGVIKVSEKDWNDVINRVNSSNFEIARLNSEKENLRRDYTDSKKRTSKYGKLVIGGAALYLLYKGVQKLGNSDSTANMYKQVINEQVKEKSKDTMKDAAKNGIKDAAKDAAKKSFGTAAMNTFEESVKSGVSSGFKEGSHDAAKTVTKGAMMVATKYAVDSLAGRDVSDAIFKANDKDNIGKFYTGLYDNNTKAAKDDNNSSYINTTWTEISSEPANKKSKFNKKR